MEDEFFGTEFELYVTLGVKAHDRHGLSDHGSYERRVLL
jgi:hypothetical protein